MNNPRAFQLPQELVDAIIDICTQSHGPAGPTLKACSLVSRAWANRARFHLFREIRLSELNHAQFLACLRDLLSLQRQSSGSAAVCSADLQSTRVVPFTTFLRELILDDGTQWHESWLMATYCPLKEIDRCMQMTQVRLEALTLLHLSTYYDDEDYRQGELWLPSRLSSRGFRQFFGSELHPQDCNIPIESCGIASYVPGRAIRSVKKLTICGPTFYSFQDFQTLAGAFPVLQIFNVEVDFWFDAEVGTWFNPVDNSFGAVTSDGPAGHEGPEPASQEGSVLLPRSVHSIRISDIFSSTLLEWVFKHFPEPTVPLCDIQHDNAVVGVVHAGSRHFAALKSFEVVVIEDFNAMITPLLGRVKAQYESELEVLTVQVRAVEDEESDDDSAGADDPV